MPNRQAFEAIIYVLRTGIQWNALPRELGASSTVHDRFQEWEKAGFFQTLWQAGLCAYDEAQGIQWEWQSVDGAMTKAPFGAAATGKNPTDRGKQGVKRSLLTDGAGIPLALIIDGANRHDMKRLCATEDRERHCQTRA
jgi:putative transposase